MVGRRGPGVVGAVARTAVVAGTAAATMHAVDRRMDNKDAKKQQEAYAEQTAIQNQAELEDMQAQMAAMQAQQAQQAMQAQMAPPPAPAPAAAQSTDLAAQLKQLADLKAAGILSDEELAAAKAKLLA
jgi:hypothetical protein